MAESLRKRIGRTSHSIYLLTLGGVRPLNPGETPFAVGSEEEAGFILARDTFYKDLLRNTLRTDTTTTSYFVGNRRFSVHTFQGVIYVEPGLVTHIGLGTFPHSSTLTIYDRKGLAISSFPFAGNPLIPG